MKLKKPIVILLVIIVYFVVGAFVLNTDLVKTYLRKHDMRYRMSVACLVSMPYKCGPGYDSADEQIISKINWLKLSKDESKERVLKAIQEGDEEFEALKRKKSLDEHEEFRLSVRGDVRKYQERLLSIIDHME